MVGKTCSGLQPNRLSSSNLHKTPHQSPSERFFLYFEVKKQKKSPKDEKEISVRDELKWEIFSPTGRAASERASLVILLIYCSNTLLIKESAKRLRPSIQIIQFIKRMFCSTDRDSSRRLTHGYNHQQGPKGREGKPVRFFTDLHAINGFTDTFPRPTAPTWTWVPAGPGARENYPSNSPLIWWNSHTCGSFFRGP